ncbi:hypothetical protein E3N86_13450 [Cryobacterium sp. Hz7]|uniref:hypothetical protein n=1 Tax=Cryobacterium sp. Hz7 TaxID=1259166 RepID=UPI00106C63F2|nr:hypothetical protein [Cryobacterium sp. Hz7]TFB58712.1 hypothetical protein E3N86_13450 [Cryobacterium sp. Hz7]
MSAPTTGLVPDLFTTVLKPAKAHDHVDARDVQARAHALGYKVTAPVLKRLLDDAGHPCYTGTSGRAVIMGVQFK